jgi:DNA-binding IclR family transcriptional regulator
MRPWGRIDPDRVIPAQVIRTSASPLARELTLEMHDSTIAFSIREIVSMPRSSPSVLRVVAVLNFFADHPGQAFTMTDVARSLKISQATCHGVLSGLLESGYLYRTSEKTYVLGPALLHVSEVTKNHFSPMQIVQPDMRMLADSYEAVCVAAFREGHDVVLRERAVGVSLLGYSPPRGTRQPLLPQFAAPYFVASSPAEVRDWVEDFQPPYSPEHMNSLFEGIAFVKQYGFLFGVLLPGVARNRDSPQWLTERRLFDAPIVPQLELNPADTYNPTFLSAPIFDARRKVAFCLSLQGFNRPLTGAEIERMGNHLRDICDRITASMVHPRNTDH